MCNCEDQVGTEVCLITDIHLIANIYFNNCVITVRFNLSFVTQFIVYIYSENSRDNNIMQKTERLMLTVMMYFTHIYVYCI
jgi:hypothetical protein